MAYVVAVDIGGTFTDLVAYDHDSRQVLYSKSATTYDNFVDGIMECFRKAGLAPAQASFVNHGTTLVINALIQRQGARAALVTTRGFRDILEIARGNRPAPFELHYQRDEPLIPRELRFEVAASGRMTEVVFETEPPDASVSFDVEVTGAGGAEASVFLGAGAKLPREGAFSLAPSDPRLVGFADFTRVAAGLYIRAVTSAPSAEPAPELSEAARQRLEQLGYVQ